MKSVKSRKYPQN